MILINVWQIPIPPPSVDAHAVIYAPPVAHAASQCNIEIVCALRFATQIRVQSGAAATAANSPNAPLEMWI